MLRRHASTPIQKKIEYDHDADRGDIERAETSTVGSRPHSGSGIFCVTVVPVHQDWQNARTTWDLEAFCSAPDVHKQTAHCHPDRPLSP